MPNLSYPLWVITRQDKWAYLWKARKLIEKLRNAMCDWQRDGITLTRYNKLSAKIKTRYPFKAGVKLSRAQIKDYLHTWVRGYYNVFDMIEDKLLILQDQIDTDTALDVDLERDISV